LQPGGWLFVLWAVDGVWWVGRNKKKNEMVGMMADCMAAGWLVAVMGWCLFILLIDDC
jgi:hypothetical protein